MSSIQLRPSTRGSTKSYREPDEDDNEVEQFDGRKKKRSTVGMAKVSSSKKKAKPLDDNNNGDDSAQDSDNKVKKKKTKTSSQSKKKRAAPPSDDDSDDNYLPEFDEDIVKTKKKSMPRKRTESSSDDSLVSDVVEAKKVKTRKTLKQPKKKTESSDDDVDDWQEVPSLDAEEDFDPEDYQPSLPKSVKVTVKKVKKTKKPGDWINPWVRLQMNHIRKKQQIVRHRVSLLLYLAHLDRINRLVNTSPLLRALTFSIVNFNRHEKKLVDFLQEDFAPWVKNTFRLKLRDDRPPTGVMLGNVVKSMETGRVNSSLTLSIILAAILRHQLNLVVRVVHSANPITLQAPDLINKYTKFIRKVVDDAGEPIPSSSTEKENVQPAGRKNRNFLQVEKETYEDLVFEYEQAYYWLEVFAPEETRWVCVDFAAGKVDKPGEIVRCLSSAINYVLAIDNEGCLVDVTGRYAEDYVSHAIRKRRLDDQWWRDTMKLFGYDKVGDDYQMYADADRKEIETNMANVKMPTTFAGFKCHPLYVLEKDVHKVQGIYPSDAPPLDYFRGQAVYSRDVVHGLKSKENWLRSAKVIKPGENAPYKWIKWKDGRLVGLYGHWQMEDFRPPTATNGRVPRNDYGNVEIFKPCMLPIGCVHLRLERLDRVAKQLGIDCAPAIVGFDTNKMRGSRPLYEGYVVCKEFEEVLTEQWKQWKDKQEDRQAEDKERRVLANWKRLIKAIVIRNNLIIKYGR